MEYFNEEGEKKQQPINHEKGNSQHPFELTFRWPRGR